MGQRGPKTNKNKLLLLKQVQEKRPVPLPGMTKPAQTVWKRIVGAYKPGHFRPQHYDLLRVYCEAVAIHKKMVQEIKKSGLIVEQPNGITKEHPAVTIMDRMAARMQGLSVKLQINVNATQATRGEAGGPEKPKRNGLLYDD